jgi:hypothetical protein
MAKSVRSHASRNADLVVDVLDVVLDGIQGHHFEGRTERRVMRLDKSARPGYPPRHPRSAQGSLPLVCASPCHSHSIGLAGWQSLHGRRRASSTPDGAAVRPRGPEPPRRVLGGSTHGSSGAVRPRSSRPPARSRKHCPNRPPSRLRRPVSITWGWSESLTRPKPSARSPSVS